MQLILQYFVFLFCSLHSDGPENVKLTSPSDKYYAEGSDVTLSCSADSSPAAQFHWYLNGSIELPETGSELRLMNIQMSQSGDYSCQAFNNKTGRNETSQPSAVFVLGKFEKLLLCKEIWIKKEINFC